jgi:hypothetical protein
MEAILDAAERRHYAALLAGGESGRAISTHQLRKIAPRLGAAPAASRTCGVRQGGASWVESDKEIYVVSNIYILSYA